MQLCFTATSAHPSSHSFPIDIKVVITLSFHVCEVLQISDKARRLSRKPMLLAFVLTPFHRRTGLDVVVDLTFNRGPLVVP